MEDPILKFKEWLASAEDHGEKEPTAMSLATLSADHKPSVRIVLLKGVDERGFVFYTNMTSRKGQEIAHNQHVALGFYWTLIDRQIRIEGKVERVSDAEADAYFATRLRISQLGAWASEQSAPLASMVDLQRRVTEAEERYANKDVPRPPYWGGFRVCPETIEFWSKGDYRLHERQLFTRKKNNEWTTQLLFP